MPTIVISGAGSGIGNTFVEHYGKDSANTIHALDRVWYEEVKDSDNAAKLHRHTVDTSSESSIEEFKSTIGDTAVDLFIHSAAVRGLNPDITNKDPLPANAETLEVIVPDIFREALLSNVLGSFMLIRTLLPNLKASKEKPKCIVMTSGMGSIANNSGGAYAYGSSKAALNYVVKSFTNDVPEVMFASIHPGKVDTRMTHVREEGAIDPEEAVDLMLPIIEKLTSGQSGMSRLCRDLHGEELHAKGVVDSSSS
ncbi:hypothetical protein LTR95_018230 [Oleoguttula sp. CCFEE 5521]